MLPKGSKEPCFTDSPLRKKALSHLPSANVPTPAHTALRFLPVCRNLELKDTYVSSGPEMPFCPKKFPMIKPR